MRRIVCGLAALACTLVACGHASTASRAALAQAMARNPASASDGAAVYTQNCSSCHQADGGGVAGAFPPLRGNPAVTGDPFALVRVVADGQRGAIVVHGVRYGGEMPAWKHLLSRRSIADVVTYIRISWDNAASAVSRADVDAAIDGRSR